MESLKGHLLIAAPSLLDPNFARTVVLIAEHSDDGALGVVLNRPSETMVVEAAPELDDVVEAGEVLHVGGPVQPTGLVVLAEFDDPDDAAVIALEDIGFMGSHAGDPSSVATRRARVFAGHAGWGPGQLDAEVETDDWITELAHPEDVFSIDSDELWPTVLSRMGGEYALLSRMPPDPSMN